MSADNTKILDLLDPKFPLVYKGILPKDTQKSYEYLKLIENLYFLKIKI